MSQTPDERTNTPCCWCYGHGDGKGCGNCGKPSMLWGQLEDARAALATSESRCRQLEQERAALVSALRALTEGMDRAGGDRDGMPECPWCHSGPGMGLSDDGESHTADCELLKARELLALLPPPGETRDTP